jgi:hypothetical protein
MTGTLKTTPAGGVYGVYTSPVPRRSAGKPGVVNFSKSDLFRAIGDFGELTAGMIRQTYPAASQHATCNEASSHLGCSPDTVERILRGQTKAPDARLLFAILADFPTRRQRPFELGGGFFINIGSEVAN